MKNALLFLFFAWAISSAQATKGVDDDHFRIQGRIYEKSVTEGGTVVETPFCQVVVYQNKELFVAFFSSKDGSYEFNLPIGFEYEVMFGGSAFVNQKIQVDTKGMHKRPGGYDLDLDIELFRVMDGYEFPLLNEPFVKIGWDAETEQLIQDELYTLDRKRELEKLLKKIRKEKKA
jgi:hypothetical protein